MKSLLMSCIRDLNYGRRWSEVTNGEAGSTFYRSEESAHSGRSVSLRAWWGRGRFSVQFIRRHVPHYSEAPISISLSLLTYRDCEIPLIPNVPYLPLVFSLGCICILKGKLFRSTFQAYCVVVGRPRRWGKRGGMFIWFTLHIKVVMVLTQHRTAILSFHATQHLNQS